MKTEIGGDRLGYGNKQEVSLRNYERSSHDLGYIWRSSMASGTLVPFMSEVALPGDSFDIDLDCDVKTLPTVGPLFGSYKVQLDVFQCPIRLYNGKLHMNMLNIGMDMSQILLPQLDMRAYYDSGNGDNQQINSSSIYSYLNIRGLGKTGGAYIKRYFNAIPYLGYWDIYKNYYANKQEERGFVVHAEDNNEFKVLSVEVTTENSSGTPTGLSPYDVTTIKTIDTSYTTTYAVGLNVEVKPGDVVEGKPDPESVIVAIDGVNYNAVDVFRDVITTSTGTGGYPDTFTIEFSFFLGARSSTQTWLVSQSDVANTIPNGEGLPQLVEFPLDNIDDMRMDILEAVRNTTAFIVDSTSAAPYGLGLAHTGSIGRGDAKFYKLELKKG